MELFGLHKPWGKSTYLSEIFEGVDDNGKRYVVKRNRSALTKDQFDFFSGYKEKSLKDSYYLQNLKVKSAEEQQKCTNLSLTHT